MDLITPTTVFGPAEWVFFLTSIIVALGGVYLLFVHRDRLAERGNFLRQLGIGALISGLLGAVVGGLRLANIALAGFWFTIVTILFVLLIVYALYYATSVLPKRIAAAQALSRGRGGGARPSPARANATPRAVSGESKSLSANGSAVPAVTPRPAGTGSRRESRRDRKRRNK